MIDFISASAKVGNDHILSKPNLEWFTTIDNSTGEIKSYFTKFQHLKFNLKFINSDEWLLTIKGSIHKYWHGTNHTDFDLLELTNAINGLCEMIEVKPEDIQIKSLEYGLNFEPPIETWNWIDSLHRVVSSDFKEFSVRSGGKTIGNYAQLTNYNLKAYSKSQEYSLEFDLARFECKVKNKKYFDSKEHILEISTFADLTNPVILTKLKIRLLAHYNEILKIEPVNVEAMTKADLRFYEKAIQKNYFNKLHRENKVLHKKHKRRLREIIEAYRTGNVHTEIMQIMNDKWELLMLGQTPKFQKLEFDSQTKESAILQGFDQNEKSTILHTFVNSGATAAENEKSAILQYKYNCNTVLTNIRPDRYFQNTPPPSSAPRFCRTCGTDISHQKDGSIFCSITTNPNAKQCRNFDSNRRYRKRQQIAKIKAKIEQNKVFGVLQLFEIEEQFTPEILKLIQI